MAYSDDINALSPNHAYSFDGNTTDRISTANGTNSGGILTSSGICQDTTNCYETNGTTDRCVLLTATTINGAAQDRKAVGGWFVPTAIQNPPKSIYGEGDATTSFRFILGWGNALMFEVNSVATGCIQIYGDVVLDPNRPYHIFMVFEGNGHANEVRCYLDGVKQLDANPIDRQPNNTTLAARGVGEFGDPAGTVGVGGTAVLILAPINGRYNEWAIWDGASAVLTDNQIREELFEKGALADVTITDQLGLDALADTVRANAPLCIRVDVAGSINLTADNITFNPLASIHVQYTGTGTLNWTNTNGSTASIGSTPNGGTLNFINPATLTINGLINGSEVRIYDDEIPADGSMNTELDGIESLIGTSFAFAHSGATNTIKVQMMADGYEEIIQSVVLSSIDQVLTVFPIVELND